MFAIYDQFNMRFRDSLDELNKVMPILQSSEISSNSQQDFKKALHDTEKDYEQNKNIAFNFNKEKSKHTQEAINAYKKIAKISYNEEIYHINQIMTKNVITANEDDTILSAIELMNEYDISQIPIIKKEDTSIGGMLNKDDILKLLIDNFVFESKISELFVNNDILENTISTILNYFVITTDPITDVRRVAKVMNQYHLNALAVVDESSKLVGIVSKSDIIEVIANDPHYQMWS